MTQKSSADVCLASKLARAIELRDVILVMLFYVAQLLGNRDFLPVVAPMFRAKLWITQNASRGATCLR